MVINDVSYNNLDMLYDAIIQASNNTQYGRKLGENMNKLLSHCSITFNINDLTIFETYIMKLFSNDNNMIITNSYLSLESTNEKYAEMINQLDNLSIMMNNDNDLSIKVNELFYFTGHIFKNVIVTFTGISLCNIIGVLPDIWFKETLLTEKSNGTNLPDALPCTKNLLDGIVNSLVNNFYSFMEKTVNRIDLAVDSYINSNYYSYANNNDTNVNLAEVLTPFGSLLFFGDRASNLSNDIQKCKNVFKYNTAPADSNYLSYSYKNTNIYFVINCTFYAFLEMFLSLPSNFFVDNQDFKTLFADSANLIIPNFLTSYKMRLSNNIKNIIDIRKDVSSSQETSLMRYNYIPLNSSFKFTMKLSLNDISSTLSKYQRAITEDHIYGDSNNYIAIEILKIINEINQNSKTVYTLLSN